MADESNQTPKRGLGRPFLRNNILEDGSMENPIDPTVHIKRECGDIGSEPQSEPMATEEIEVATRVPKVEPGSQPSISIPDVGVRAEDLLSLFNLEPGERPTISVHPRQSEIEAARVKHEEPDSKRAKVYQSGSRFMNV